MEKTIEDLRLEADELGIQYPKNTGAAKLQTKIDEFYDAESEDSIVEQIAEVDGEDTVAASFLTATSTLNTSEKPAAPMLSSPIGFPADI